MFKILFLNLDSELKLYKLFAYFEVKNGIIFAYRWRGVSRAVAAWKGARVEKKKRIDTPTTEIWKIVTIGRKVR